jgi:hypothetical protein
VELDSWFKWLMLYLYEGGAAFLLIASLVFARKTKTILCYVAALGFCAFLVGNQIMSSAQTSSVQATQTNTPVTAHEQQFHLGRILSSFGFFVGAGSLLIFAFRGKTNP